MLLVCISIHFGPLSCTVNLCAVCMTYTAAGWQHFIFFCDLFQRTHLYMKWTLTGDTTAFSFFFTSANHHCLRILSVMDLYTYSIKPKWQMTLSWIFAARSSAVAYLQTSDPLEHSTVDVPGPCEVAIQQRTTEEITDYRFKLIFVYLCESPVEIAD